MDSESVSRLPGADWYPDPIGRHELRYWDGAAWSDNVADGGRTSVDPVEAPPAPPVNRLVENEALNHQVDNGNPAALPVPSTARVPDTSAEPRHARRGTKTFVILGLVLLLVVALGSEGYSMVSKSSAAKDAAASSIAAARKAIAEADLAVEPGSQELTESQKSKSALNQATALYAEGSVFQPGRYGDAKAKAAQARKIALGIIDRVAAMAADASNASADDAVALYFALYQKYPRTPQGKDAIASAAGVLLDSLGSGSAVDNLDSIDAFCTDCPGDVPTTVFDAAATSIRSIGSDSLDSQSSMVSSNKSWVKKLRGKGASFTISGTTAADTSQLTHVIGILPTVQGAPFRAAMTLLRDCSKMGERCSKIARSPVRKSGRSSYFSVGQVNQIATLSKQMGAKLAKARALLKNL
jgi:hypothetical protein